MCIRDSNNCKNMTIMLKCVPFVDLEKALGQMDRNLLRKILEAKGYSRHLIQILRGFYKDTK